MTNDKLLRKLIREMIDQKLVYHLSPEHDIEKFEPREFVFSDDGVTSGAVGTSSLKGRVERLVYASPAEWAPLYSLPRETPRAFIQREDDVFGALVEKLPGFNVGKKNMLVSREDIPKMKSHSWTVYAFNASDFQPLDPEGIEWVSRKAAVPVSKKRMRDSVKFLIDSGINVIPVDDVKSLVEELWEEGYQVNAEGI